MAPSEFWRCNLHEWWRIYDVKRPRDPAKDFAGRMRETDVERMYEELMK